MTKVTYKSMSPYYNTDQVNVYLEYLDFWKGSYIPKRDTDVEYVVHSKYEHRPHLLSFDMYGTVSWWYVFALRNPDVIKDPIFDLKPGITIFLPSKENLPKA